MSSSHIDPSAVPGLENLIEAAIADDWDQIDAALLIGNAFISEGMFAWATEAARLDTDNDVRDLAASILLASDRPLSELDTHLLVRHALTDAYRIVRFRLALALYKRGVMDGRIVSLLVEATKDPDVGPCARAMIDEKFLSRDL